jgi:Immunoglobulin-like domain of bacterial spore germination/Sporulation and spore germination
MTDDEWVRNALDDAVSDVEPHDALDAIRSRTKGKPMNNQRPWIYGAVGAVLATAATITAFALVNNGDDPTTENDPGFAGNTSTSPTPTPDETPSATTTPEPSTFTVAAYFLGETGRGPKLYREFQHEKGADVGSAAVTAVLGGADDGDYTSPWQGLGLGVNSVDGNADLVTIDLAADDLTKLQRPAGMDDATANLAIEQLMRTAQGALKAGRAPVQFLADGKHVNEILGVPTSEPLANASDDDVLAHVWINTPAEGAEVSAGDTVEGLASSFEANVTWELRQGDTVVEQGFTMAAEAFKMAPYSFKLPQVPAGEYTLVVSEDDPSGGEGFGPDSDTKVIVIR